ncbi:MAG: T9SS type A sorting domain-containing protein [Flavobacteriales bacterium]|nr:T9SS type A sorting domain-containing protein [Flavobacteriales bacterium]
MKKHLLLLVCFVFLSLTGFSQTKLTHSSSDNIWSGNSITCNTGGIIADNYFMRRFYLDSFNILDTAYVLSMEFSIETATGGPYKVRNRVYTLSGEFIYTNLSLVVGDTTDIWPDSTSYTMETFFDPGYYLLPGDTAVAEIYAPSDPSVSFFLASNALTETDTSFLIAPACGINQPTTVDDIDFPGTHWVMHVWVNQRPAIGTVRDTTLKETAVYIPQDNFNEMMMDNDGDNVGIVRLATLPPNGVLSLEGTVLDVGDSIYSSQLDSLLYTPNPGFFGDDSFEIDIRDQTHWSYGTSLVEIHVINWVVSVDELEKEWSIYPNPVNNELRIEGFDQLKSIQIFDQQGRLVFESNKSSNTIALGHLPKGSYWLKLTDQKGTYEKQFIKE